MRLPVVTLKPQRSYRSCCRYFVDYRRLDVLYSMMHSAHNIGRDRGILLTCTENPPQFFYREIQNTLYVIAMNKM